MLNNLPLKTTTHKGLTIEGYSRGAVQTYWRVPELKVGFDLGASPWSFMSTPSWFVTHAHLDHIAALPVYVARRRMMKMEPPTIYLPETTVPYVEKLLKIITKLDRGRLPCTLQPVKEGDEFELSREHVVTAHATQHTVPSFGYVVWERRKKLKPEYHELSGEQIRDIRLSGIDVTHETRTPLVGYLGDSAPAGLDNNPCLFEAQVLICEMTFVAPHHRKEKIHKYGHMHLEDFLDPRDQFHNELVIASHFSTRYHNKQIRDYVEKRWPNALDGRLQLWL